MIHKMAIRGHVDNDEEQYQFLNTYSRSLREPAWLHMRALNDGSEGAQVLAT